MKTIEIKDLYKQKYISSLTYSPKGKSLCYLVKQPDEKENNYSSDLYLLKGKKTKQRTSSFPVLSFRFLDDEHILFVSYRDKEDQEKKKDGHPYTPFYSLVLNGGEAEKLFTLRLSVLSYELLDKTHLILLADVDLDKKEEIELLSKDGSSYTKEIKSSPEDYQEYHEVPFVLNGAGVIDHHRSVLFLYDRKKKKLEQVSPLKANVSSFDFDSLNIYYGAEIIEKESNGKQGVYSYSLSEKKTERILKPRRSLFGLVSVSDKIRLIGTEKKRYGENENPFFYTLDKGTKELKIINEADESLGIPVLSDVLLGARRGFKQDQGYVYFFATDRYDTHLKRIGIDGKIETIVPFNGSLTDFDVKDGKIRFTGLFDRKLNEVYALEENTKIQLTNHNEAYLKEKYVGHPEHFVYSSKGYELDGFVIYPKDYDPTKKYPAILDIHGGPKCAYGVVYSHERQVMANKGYFVLYTNPFGSDGRGNDFAYLTKWGDIDYHNFLDFVDICLSKIPSIDSANVFLTGGSYGGYRSNWREVHTDQFKAIVTQRSISNWITRFGNGDIGPNFAFGQTSHDIYSKEGFEELFNISPIKYVKNAKTPILILHSDEDYRCPLEQGVQFFTALIHQKVEAQRVIFHGENHDRSRGGKPKNRITRLEKRLTFFDEHKTI